MNDLHPGAAALMRAGRTAFRPDAADRERVLASLETALGGAALSEGARHAGRAVTTQVALRTWLAGGLAAVALATGAVLVSHRWARTPPPPAPASVQPTVPLVEAAPPPPALSSTDPGSAPEALSPAVRALGSPRAPSRSTPRIAPDSLREEVRLLTAAEQQMNSGRAVDALKILAEHERRFAAGALAEERMAARAQALCALGRTAEAESELGKLAGAYPHSQHLEHARMVCGIGSARP